MYIHVYIYMYMYMTNLFIYYTLYTFLINNNSNNIK